MSKHVFVIKEQLCQSFWQLIKAFTFETKNIKGEGESIQPPFEAFRVKLKFFTWGVFTTSWSINNVKSHDYTAASL